MYVEHNKFIT